MKCTGFLVGFAALVLFTHLTYSQATQEWAARFNGPGNSNDRAWSVATDTDGNVYVTGDSYSGTSNSTRDYSTIKYNSAGVFQWESRYDGPGNNEDVALSIAVDAFGNSYVAGYSLGGSTETTEDIATVKYNSSGVQQWVARYNGTGNARDQGFAIRVDATGNVYVTGHTNGGGYGDVVTLKYDPNGNLLWDRVIAAGGTGVGYALAVDGVGNAHVTGWKSGDMVTVKYDASGTQQWLQTFNGAANGQDQALSIALDGSANVYVTGWSTGSGSGLDVATIKYDASGVQQWVQTFNGSANSTDFARGIVVDSGGNVYSGASVFSSGTNFDFAIIKYQSSGTQEWVHTYDGPGHADDQIWGVALDGLSNVYATGHCTGSGSGLDYLTMKVDPSGQRQWEMQYDGGVNGTEYPRSIAVDNSLNVYITGQSDAIANVTSDYATIKYSQAFEPILGTIAGTVNANGSGLAGVTVRLLDADGLPVDGIDPTTANADGEYVFADLLSGDYQVMIVEPLGYGVDANPLPVSLAAGATATVDFVLSSSVISNASRGKGYWKHQFDVYLTGKGASQETQAQLESYTSSVHSFYDPHFTVFASTLTFADWQAMLSSKKNASMLEKAKEHLAALVLNFASLKIGQYTGVTADSRTAGDVLTYVSTLVSDGIASNDEMAKDLAEQVNEQETIAAGIVPAGSILYKGAFGRIVWGFDLPGSFALSQNYPNPFNPTTVIQYDIPIGGHVSLVVFDYLGREVVRLLDEYHEPGRYMTEWNATTLASGVYFYRLKANDFTSTKRLLLLK
jgi:hypothetical protein